MAFMSESDEKESLIMSTPTTTKVVYFLKPSMSKALLCKFPDNSFAFDFDYTQSSIWSPLVPRLHSAMDLDIKPRNRRFSIGNGKKNKLKKLTSNIKKKLNVTTFNLNLNPFNNNKINPSHFSETPLKTTCYPPTTKAWTKALKATSKHFKKKKKDPMAHVKLSTYLRGIEG
ncbi:hypothetical protein FCV25MIE_34029 [Fagus crenata]